MKEPKKDITDIDPATILVILGAAILLPLLFAGFLFQ